MKKLTVPMAMLTVGCGMTVTDERPPVPDATTCDLCDVGPEYAGPESAEPASVGPESPSDVVTPFPVGPPVDDMACWGHTSTLLDDGRVLLVGACRLGEQWIGAALFQDGAFEPIAIEVPLVGHAATLLPAGDVLISGGVPLPADFGFDTALPLVDQPHARAWLFRPHTTVFSETAAMAEPRSWHAAASLAGERVVVTGGQTTHDGDPSASALASVEAYDVVGAVWSARAPMFWTRHHHSATATDDGGVLVAGGLSPQQGNTARPCMVERYEHASDAWSVSRGGLNTSYNGEGPGVQVATPEGPIFVRGDGNMRFSGDVWEDLPQQGPFWPLSAAWQTGEQQMLAAGLGHYGGLLISRYDPAANSWDDGAFLAGVAGATSAWRTTLTELPTGAVLAIGELGSAVIDPGLVDAGP